MGFFPCLGEKWNRLIYVAVLKGRGLKWLLPFALPINILCMLTIAES